jgi:hypothetical protein
MSGFCPVIGQHFVFLLSAFCRFQNLETPFAENYFAYTNFYFDCDHANSKKHFDPIGDLDRIAFDRWCVSIF